MTIPTHAETAIIGSGFAGLAAAIRLAEAGRDYVVLERAGDVGGTWRDNSYPGCACDVPSHLYSFSFAPNPDWTRSFSPQQEIQDYLRRTARQFGVLPRTHFHAEVREAYWDDSVQLWQIHTARGNLSARFLIVAVGPLSEPSRPGLPGLDGFRGTAFHSATWRHDHDLTGEEVAVIGTGASAIQFVPQIQPLAGSVTIFQRTAPWVLPRRDRAIRPAERWLYRRFPLAQRAARSAIYWGRESWILGFSVRPRMMALAEKQGLRYLARGIPDPDLRAKLTPHFRLGCKRVLLSNDYYPALRQPNVTVVTDPILEVTERGVVSADPAGSRTEHRVDTIIFGTGFHVTDPPIAERLRGRDGRTLAEHWQDGMSALHGLTVAGFPNMFFLVGPNTGLGHTSIVFMIEVQVRYILDALAQLADRSLAVLEPRPEVQHAYNAELQTRLARTVWNVGGCASWYLDPQGRNTTVWPTFTFTF
ncbi:MAG: flavin-containing monooxygenase, partial [Mycobacteriales bacterium]